MAMIARPATQNDPDVQAIESAHEEKKLVLVFTSYYGNKVSL